MTAISGNSSHLTCATRSPEPRLVDRVLSHRSGRPVGGILRCSVRAPDDRDQRFRLIATTHSVRSRWRQTLFQSGSRRCCGAVSYVECSGASRNYGRSVADIASGGGTPVAAANPQIDRSLTAEICAALNQAIPRNRGRFRERWYASVRRFELQHRLLLSTYPRTPPEMRTRGWPWRCAASR